MRVEAGSVVDTLNKCGVAIAPWRMTTQKVADMIGFLDDCLVWPAHVMCKAPAEQCKPLRDARGSGEWPVMSPRMMFTIGAPYFFEFALQSYAIAEAYFGEAPLLYSMNSFWTQPAGYSYVDTHGWHRDGDDRKQLAMFLMGTDTSDGDGAHLYQRGTHRVDDNALGYHFTSPPGECVINVAGLPGTMFFSDPSGLHMGLRPTRPRMLAWARWGVSCPPASYLWDQLEPVPRAFMGDRYPADPKLQEAIRLVVN